MELLEQLLLACLAKQPADRPADAAALAQALTGSGTDEWTQEEARRWWEMTFTPPPAPEIGPSAIELLEIGMRAGRD